MRRNTPTYTFVDIEGLEQEQQLRLNKTLSGYRS